MKNTKKSIWASGISLMICIAMLAGTTFAWFTDSVVSSGNIIKSGSLDVTMEWADGTQALDSAEWKDASKGPIFTSEKWEPGYAEVRHVRISNAGTLALKYEVSIVPSGEIGKLAEVIDVYYVKGGQQIAKREDLNAMKPVGTLKDVLANPVAKGHILEGAADTATIVLKMQDTAGNAYQNLSIGSDFSVQLSATQYTHEQDGFGDNQYDKDAWLGTIDTSWYNDSQTEFSISEPAQLAGLARLVNNGNDFAGKTITLTDDIDLNNAAWTPIGGNVSFAGTFDGLEHTISNLKLSSVSVSVWEGYKNTYNYAGLFGSISGTIKNLSLKGCDVSVTDTNNSRRGDVYAGVLAGANFGTIENVSVSGSNVSATAWLISSAGAIVGSNVGTVNSCSSESVNVFALSEGWTANAGGIVGASGDRLYWNLPASVTQSHSSGNKISAKVTGAATTNDIDYPSPTTYFGRVYCGGIGGLAVNTTSSGNKTDSNTLNAESYASGNNIIFKNDEWGY